MPSERPGAAAESGARWARWAALFFTLLAEYEIITLGVDGRLVALARGGSWSQLGGFELFGSTAFLCVTSLLVLARPSQTQVMRLPVRVERQLLGAHVASFACFWFLTHLMLGRATAPPGPALAWISAWAVLGAGSGVALGLGLIGVPRMRARVLVPSLLACLGLAWAMSQIGLWTQGLWRPFSSGALGLAGALLRCVSPAVIVDAPGLVLELDGFAVRVESGCSGLEGVGMIAALGGAYLALFRKELRFPRAFALLASAVVLTWLANAVRLAAMVWLGSRVSPELALGGFHSKAGWVLFSSIALGMAFVGHHVPFFAREREAGARAAVTREPTTSFLLPLLVLIAAALVLGMFGRGEGPWYGLRMLLGLATLLLFRRGYDGDLRWLEPGAGRACLLGAVLGLFWLGSSRWAHADVAGPDSAGLGWLLVRAVGFCTIVPLAEELAFRGYLLRALQGRDFARVSYRAGAWWAVVVSSLLFGALHERWFAGTLAGLAYAAIQIKAGRLRDAVLAHAVTNATLAVFALATQNPALFG